MKILTRYLIGHIVKASLFALLALVSLFLFFEVLSEMGSLGRGSYTFGKILVVALLQVPTYAYQLMPLAVLIGAMVAMSLLSASSEYTVMRTYGISLRRMAATLAGIGLLFSLANMLLGEFASPYSEQLAEQTKLKATNAYVSQQFRSGLWVKDNNHYINVKEILPDNTLLDIRIYTLDAEDRITSVCQAERGVHQADGSWQLEGVHETGLSADRTVTRQIAAQKWESVLQPELLTTLLVAPERMSLVNLTRYIDHLKHNKQSTSRYEIALWGKLFYPLACLTMALVALAFTPVSQRQVSLGLRIFVGILIGLAFYFTNRLLSHLGLLYSWSPALVTLLPTLVFLCAGSWAIARQETR